MIAKLQPKSAGTMDVKQVRREFPILDQKVHGKPLVYLDNAATTQKPKSVIEATDNFYLNDNSNIHRAVHALSERATKGYEDTRETVRRFLNAAHTKEIVFTRGTTDGINLVAQTYVRSILRAGDEILISGMEHHSNIVPWQILCEQVGAKLCVSPITDEGEISIDDFRKRLTSKTRFVSVAHVSNALGTVNPIREIIELAHRQGAHVLIDGAQGASRYLLHSGCSHSFNEVPPRESDEMFSADLLIWLGLMAIVSVAWSMFSLAQEERYAATLEINSPDSLEVVERSPELV